MADRKSYLRSSVIFITLMQMILAASLSKSVWAVPPEKNARAWLDQMSRSMRELNYQGEFTYEHASQITTLQIFHAVKEGVEYERLVHLDGDPREIVRRGHELSCIHPGTRMIRLDVSAMDKSVGPQGESLAQSAAVLGKYYDLQLLEKYRVAGRKTVQIAIKPKDGYRHAHRLFVDEETGLLLKSLLLDSQNHPLERFQYTHIEIGTNIEEADLQAKAEDHLYAHHHGSFHNDSAHKGAINNGSHTKVSAVSRLEQKAVDWTVRWVPAGFLKTTSSLQASQDAGLHMYTDGLSAFTVFLEPSNEPMMGDGVAQQGGTVAFTRQLLHKGDKYLVTVVGEIPSLTAEKVASSVRAN